MLYVTFFEVLEREKLEKVGMTGLLGAALLIIGFSMMAGLEAVGKKYIFEAPSLFRETARTFSFTIRIDRT